jgi:hypothetical protein
MTDLPPDRTGDTPELSFRRLLYVVAGGTQATFAPMWLQWLRDHYPHLEVRCAVTRSALRFTTPTALAAAAGRPALVDAWPDQPESALHVELAQWPDAVLVHPATLDFVARLALGRGDSPVMLALQCTAAQVALCPGLPPRAHLNPAYRRHVAELSERDNLSVLPPRAGRSQATGELELGTAVYLPSALSALAELTAWQATA